MPKKLRYIAVADAIRQEILDGVYLPGDRLPRQHDLAKEHNVAFNTLKQALDLLSGEGYIVRKVAQGTYAALPEPQVPTAMVVDDDAHVRTILTRALRNHRWEATAVDSGEAALAALENQSFDLIFLDLIMAGMNGAQTFQEIRRKDASAQVVIITAYPDSEMMVTAMETGPFAVMLKPFSLNQLRSFLDERKPQPQLPPERARHESRQ
ncbi:MAG: response regulator [Chloroflexi bacterium]|nr:response regulator [Chloroflexota bacterium]